MCKRLCWKINGCRVQLLPATPITIKEKITWKKCNGFPQNQGKKYFLEIYCLIYLFGWPSLLILVSSYYNYMKNCEHLFDFKSHSSSHFPIHYLFEDLSFCKGRKDLFLSVQTGLRYCCCCVTLQRAISKVFFSFWPFKTHR